MQRHAVNTKQPGASVLLDEWGTSGPTRPTMEILLNYLVEAELYRAADYISINILNEPPTRPPRNTPSPPPVCV